jgi:hypothetical protein
MAKYPGCKWRKSVFLGTKEDINRAYANLTEALILDSVKSLGRRRGSTAKLKKLYNYLFPNKII